MIDLLYSKENGNLPKLLLGLSHEHIHPMDFGYRGSQRVGCWIWFLNSEENIVWHQVVHRETVLSSFCSYLVLTQRFACLDLLCTERPNIRIY